MRKFMGVAVGLLVLTAGSAAAQTSTGTVGASAQVQASIAASNPVALDFGSLPPVPGDITVNTGVAGVGSIQIAHNSAFSTTVQSASAALTAGGATDLPVVFNCAYATTAAGAIDGAETLCSAIGDRAVTTLGTSQTSFLQVGGVLTIPANVEPGTYNGSISFLFTANGF